MIEKGILETETDARARLEPELRRHLDLGITAFNLMADVANAAPDPIPNEAPKAVHVGLALLLRVSNDLRCVVLLAETGYPLQAASLVASMHEAAYTIPYIGSDEELAEEWQHHSSPTRPFRSAAKLTRRGVTKLGVSDPDSEATQVFKTYSQLCWAKHIAPFYELEVSLDVQDGQATAVSGPNTTDAGIRAAWYALEKAVWYAYIAMRSMIHFHFSDRIGDTLDPQIRRMCDEYAALQAAFIKRWGNEDPFPGQWRDFGKQLRNIPG